ncbi:MAG TPA: sialidase family protein [Nitrososphaeraceae archaeon]|nr:sialidase family protein [Nitrososphaeraceae archaeon]
MLAYDYEIFAFNGANIDKFQNKVLEKSLQNNYSTIINFPNSNITNLTNNNEDSIYGQIAAYENNVYVVWQESVIESLPEHNYDIFFIKSENKGRSFSNPINLSNNNEYSERPQMAVSKNSIFIVWAENVDNNNNNNKQIMFTKSEDNGTTFSKVINLSNNSKNSDNPEISVFNENVYVVWQESDKNNTNTKNNKNIVFKNSLDNGNTFNNSLELIKNTKDAFPKINSYGNNVYIVWNNENKNNNSGLFLVKSSDKGNSFEKGIKLTDQSNSGESQIAVDKNEVLVVWGGFLSKNIDNIYYVKSNDNGNTFTSTKTISDKKNSNSNNINDYRNFNEIINNPINVEVPNNNLSFVVWQNTFSNENADILLLLLNNNNQTDNSNYTMKLLNLSNNTSLSECPSIAIANNNVYVIWEDFISGNHEILFVNVPL